MTDRADHDTLTPNRGWESFYADATITPREALAMEARMKQLWLDAEAWMTPILELPRSSLGWAEWVR